MTDSYTTPTSFIGPDATQLARAICLRSGVQMHRKLGMIPTRGVTITKMFAMAKQYTGQTYKRGEHERCEADLTTWIKTMRSALPHVADAGAAT